MSYLYPDGCIVQFAKAPELGRVKTRLSPALGDEGCLQLHKQLVEHTFNTLSQSGVAPVELEVTGLRLNFFQQLISGAPVLLRQQRGSDLGERMLHAVADRLHERSAVIIVGSDCPSIDSRYLEQAFAVLAAGSECVLGPATDGGYVLIGLRKADSHLFSTIPWGTDQVLEMTRQRLDSLGWRWEELAPLSDIDRPEDLKLLPELP